MDRTGAHVIASGLTVSVPWTAAYDAELTGLIREVVAGRDAAWKELLERIGPRIEEWAARNATLRRLGLTSEDEPRAVLVNVLVRLKRDDFANLRSFLGSLEGRGGDDPEERIEADMVEDIVRYAAAAREERDVPDARDGGADDTRNTPFRGWLLTLVRYAVKDHIKQRMGWSGTAKASFALEPAASERQRRRVERALACTDGILDAWFREDGGQLTVVYLPGTLRSADMLALLEQAGLHVTELPSTVPGKRDLNSDAERLRPSHAGAERPPITDLLTLLRLVKEVRAFIATFPEPMQAAFDLWLHDVGFAEIALRLELDGGESTPAEEARKLVRAAQARLRERFRADWERFVSTRPGSRA